MEQSSGTGLRIPPTGETVRKTRKVTIGAAGWLHKVRTGSGSDWVVSESVADHYKVRFIREKKQLRMRFDPVATALGSDFA
jgi:hypothetical protein